MNDARSYYAVEADRAYQRGEWLFAEVARQRGAELAVRASEEWELERPVGATKAERLRNWVSASMEFNRREIQAVVGAALLLGLQNEMDDGLYARAFDFARSIPPHGPPVTPLRVAAWLATYLMLPNYQRLLEEARREADAWGPPTPLYENIFGADASIFD